MKNVYEIELRAVDLESLGISIVFTNTDNEEQKETARKNAWIIRDAFKDLIDSSKTPKELAVSTLRENITGNSYEYLKGSTGEFCDLVEIIESESGWWQRVDEVMYFRSKGEALDFVLAYNTKFNNTVKTPDWYMYASYGGKV